MCKTPFLGSRLLIHHFAPLPNLPSKTSLPLTDSGTSESEELLGRLAHSNSTSSSPHFKQNSHWDHEGRASSPPWRFPKLSQTIAPLPSNQAPPHHRPPCMLCVPRMPYHIHAAVIALLDTASWACKDRWFHYLEILQLFIKWHCY